MKNFNSFTTWVCGVITLCLLLISCESSKDIENNISTYNNDITSLINISSESIKEPTPIFKYHIISDKEIEENFYKQRIPSTYSDAFLYYTKDTPELRMAFYSIMVHESGNFTVFKRKNANGSYDLGPSHLNSNNIKNAYFRELYNPKDESHITTVYCFYMIMSLNYFKDMLNKFNNYTDAFYAYNGGQKAPKIINSNKISKNKINFVRNVKAYANAVNKNVVKYEKELDEYKTQIKSDIEYGIEYVRSNSNKFKNYTDVYISFNETGSGITLSLKNVVEIDLLASNSVSNRIYKLTSNIIVADRRKDDILNLIKNERVIS